MGSNQKDPRLTDGWVVSGESKDGGRRYGLPSGRWVRSLEGPSVGENQGRSLGKVEHNNVLKIHETETVPRLTELPSQTPPPQHMYCKLDLKHLHGKTRTSKFREKWLFEYVFLFCDLTGRRSYRLPPLFTSNVPWHRTVRRRFLYDEFKWWSKLGRTRLHHHTSPSWTGQDLSLLGSHSPGIHGVITERKGGGGGGVEK